MTSVLVGVTDAQFNAVVTKMDAARVQLEAQKADMNEALDTIWMLLAGMLVFFMHTGFSLLEAGCVRFKNTQNILAKNLIVVTLGFLCWYAIGYAIAIGVGSSPNEFIGGANFFMDGFWGAKESFRVWFFQGAFCATAGTIVSGAMAERTQLKGFIIYTCLMTGVIYPVVAYWGLSGSGLFNNADGKSLVGPGLLDFAGSGIVHLTGGVGALVGAAIVGPRKDRWELPDEFNGHSIPFVVLGTFFLWFGWYGFNPGSTLAMKTVSDANIAGLVAVNTTLSPCVCGLIVFALRATVVQPKCLDVGGFCNGILAGLVAITAGCAFVKPWEACLIGMFGAFFYQGTSMLMRLLKLDDVVDAFAVHGACGIWGVVALGFFGNPKDGMGGNGVFYGGDAIATQLVFPLFVMAWVGVLSVIILLPLRLVGALRLGDEIQDEGADIKEHSPPKAYNDAAKS